MHSFSFSFVQAWSSYCTGFRVECTTNSETLGALQTVWTCRVYCTNYTTMKPTLILYIVPQPTSAKPHTTRIYYNPSPSARAECSLRFCPNLECAFTTWSEQPWSLRGMYTHIQHIHIHIHIVLEKQIVGRTLRCSSDKNHRSLSFPYFHSLRQVSTAFFVYLLLCCVTHYTSLLFCQQFGVLQFPSSMKRLLTDCLVGMVAIPSMPLLQHLVDLPRCGVHICCHACNGVRLENSVTCAHEEIGPVPLFLGSDCVQNLLQKHEGMQALLKYSFRGCVKVSRHAVASTTIPLPSNAHHAASDRILRIASAWFGWFCDAIRWAKGLFGRLLLVLSSVGRFQLQLWWSRCLPQILHWLERTYSEVNLLSALQIISGMLKELFCGRIRQRARSLLFRNFQADQCDQEGKAGPSCNVLQTTERNKMNVLNTVSQYKHFSHWLETWCSFGLLNDTSTCLLLSR